MNKKALVTTLAVTCLVVSYATYDYVVENRRAQMKEDANRIVTFQTDQIKEVEILTKGIAESVQEGEPLLSNKIKLVKRAEGWHLIEPIQEFADQNSVTEFVEGLTSEKASEVVLQGNSIDWKVFGLHDPRGQIAITNQLGERKTFLVSSKKNYQGDAFLRQDKNEKVLLANGSWFSKLEKKPIDFRDKRLLRKPIADVTQMTVMHGNEKFAVQLVENKWVVEEKPALQLDQSRVRDVLAILTNPVIKEFMKESEASPEEIKKWGFDKRRARVKLDFKDQSQWSADLTRDEQMNHYVQLSEPFLIAKLGAADAEKLATLTLDTLRDRREPFRFAKDEVRRVLIETTKGRSEFEMKNDKWQVVSQSVKDHKVDLDKIDEFLTKVGGLEVAQFLTQKEKVDTSKGGQIVLKDESGKTLFSMQIGDARNFKVGGQNRSQALVQSSLFPQTVTLDVASLKSLGMGEFVAPPGPNDKKAEPEQAPQPQFVEPGGHNHDH